MNNFEYQNPTKIIFGRDSEAKVGAETAKFSKKVLLHFGGASARKTGLLDRIKASLASAGVEWAELGGVRPNPVLSLVNSGIELCRKEKIGFILAVGGGSVIDSAKAIAVGVPYSGDVWDFYTGKAVPASALPLGTVLTIPAAGSESSSGSVITNEAGLLKRALNHDLLYPRFSILNPVLAFTLPKNQRAYGVADIMAHLMERYFTNVPAVEFTDRLIEATLKTVISAAPLIFSDEPDYDAWADVMWAGTIAHNNLLDTGRIGDWVSHDIEHELSGIYDIPHGAGLAIIFPSWMRYTLSHDPARFAQFAARVWHVEPYFFDTNRVAEEGIQRLSKFWSSLGLPSRLADLGIGPENLSLMADKCTSGDTKTVGRFVELRKSDIEKIYTAAL